MSRKLVWRRTLPSLGMMMAGFLLFTGYALAQVTVNVEDDQGAPVANGFRWLIEEANVYGSTPWFSNQPGAIPGMQNPNAVYNNGANSTNPSYSLGVNIEKSHAPVVCAGDTAVDAGHPAYYGTQTAPSSVEGGYEGAPSSLVIDEISCPEFDSAKQYIVSVLPWHGGPAGGYQMSGRNIAAGQTNVDVIVNRWPLPTSQITFIVFEDNQPINGAYDSPAEHGLANFQAILTDASGGAMMQDQFARPIGTTYKYLYPCEADACAGPNVPADSSGNPLPPEQQPEYQYDGDGLPIVDYMGDGKIYTCGGDPSDYPPGYYDANCRDPYTLAPLDPGEAVVRYLSPNKFTIEPLPSEAGKFCNPNPSEGFSADDCSDMVLTATLEGTRGNDVWVRATEPRYNIALGQLNWLVFFGFVHSPMNALDSLGAGSSTISGQVVYVHDMHPPLSPGLSPGLPVPDAYVGLNNLNGNDEQVYTGLADSNTGQFTIDNVPPGTYQLVMWDKLINAIIDFRTVTVPDGGGSVDLGQVPVFGWFANNVMGKVFYDQNENGRPNPHDDGIPGMLVNLRFPDGSFYNSTLTDPDGTYSFSQYFPWWRYLIAETDNGRLKPTGLTAVVDEGGDLTNNKVYLGSGETYAEMGINPQIQPGGNLFRSENGRVTTEAFNVYGDMTARIDFGKAAYSGNENGGILGGINYATTRTEEDPKNSAWDPWEPGVPNATVELHQAQQYCADANCTACSADATPPATPVNGCWGFADTDPFPLVTTSSSYSDNLPTGCVGGQDNTLWTQPEVVNGFAIPSCAETFYHWDQTRPGVFDGAYAFNTLPGNGNNQPPLPPGYYLVQVTPPPGYTVLEWADRNIEFGDPEIPYLKEVPECAGLPYDIPGTHTLFPDSGDPTDTAIQGGPGPWYEGLQAASCDTKLVALNPGANGAADFNLFTWVPKSARIWGTVWNDLLLEFNPSSPNASGNFGVPWLPVAIKDWKGHEIARFYTDQWGHFDGMVPSNYDIAPPNPIGLVLSMYTVAANDPGPIDTGTGLACIPGQAPVGQCITDPWFDPNYSQEVIRENWEFYAGKTTFIDTIVLPIGGFQGNRLPVNCAYVDHYPEIMQVSDVIVPQGGGDITITAVGDITVNNPDYDPASPVGPNNQPTLTWDHGFGTTEGTVTVGGTTVPASWSAGSITAAIPEGTEGQLVVTRGDNGLSTTVGITLHAAGATVMYVDPPASDCAQTSDPIGNCSVIQPAIDSATNGTIIILRPGSYQENVNLWKPVTLQGLGARVTILDGTAALGNFPLKDWQFNSLSNPGSVQSLISSGAFGIVPGQASNFTLEQGAGILVAGCGESETCGPTNAPSSSFFAPGAKARIDGLTITGATEAGGGILVNGYVDNLKITNNEINYNQGSIAGGIRSGEPSIAGVTGSAVCSGNCNPGLVIDHNRIAVNGSLFSGGGGVALYAGSDNYEVTDNMMCGNFSANYGGGIGHFGLSNGGWIEGNYIVSNESFDEGGGVHIAGETPATATALTPGAGSVVIDDNLVEGNKAGDDGGGIRTLKVNGQDVANNPTDDSQWYQVDIFNNMVVNNSSADQGGGMAFDDSVKVNVIGNTVANNDSTATGSDAFGGPCVENNPAGQVCPPGEVGGGLTTSIRQAAGITSFANSMPLQAVLPGGSADFSDPVLRDNIVWQNRSFYWDATANSNLGALVYSGIWDMAVYGTPVSELMTMSYSLATPGANFADGGNNVSGDPQFLMPYFNLYQATASGAALGNFVVAIFTPNGVQGDYHLAGGSAAANAGGSIVDSLQNYDYDGDARPATIDIGADQATGAPFHVWPK